MNRIKNTAELKGIITRYVINNHHIRINHSEFYWLGSESSTDAKWFLVCSYKGERFSKSISSESSLTIETVKTAMKQLINEITIVAEKEEATETTTPPSQKLPTDNQENKQG